MNQISQIDAILIHMNILFIALAKYVHFDKMF